MYLLSFRTTATTIAAANKYQEKNNQQYYHTSYDTSQDWKAKKRCNLVQKIIDITTD